MTIRLWTIAAVAALALMGCSDGSDEAAPEVTAETPVAPPSEAVYDEADVVDHLGLEKRPDDAYPERFEISTSAYADYRWEAEDGTICFPSNVITSASEADMAGPGAALNPEGAAGVEFYTDTENLATCSTLLEDALTDFPN